MADVAVRSFHVPGGCAFCAQYHCRESYLFSTVGAVPGRLEKDSFSE